MNASRYAQWRTQSHMFVTASWYTHTAARNFWGTKKKKKSKYGDKLETKCKKQQSMLYHMNLGVTQFSEISV